MRFERVTVDNDIHQDKHSKKQRLLQKLSAQEFWTLAPSRRTRFGSISRTSIWKGSKFHDVIMSQEHGSFNRRRHQGTSQSRNKESPITKPWTAGCCEEGNSGDQQHKILHLKWRHANLAERDFVSSRFFLKENQSKFIINVDRWLRRFSLFVVMKSELSSARART